jgi:hypothetical protein
MCGCAPCSDISSVYWRSGTREKKVRTTVSYCYVTMVETSGTKYVAIVRQRRLYSRHTENLLGELYRVAYPLCTPELTGILGTESSTSS